MSCVKALETASRGVLTVLVVEFADVVHQDAGLFALVFVQVQGFGDPADVSAESEVSAESAPVAAIVVAFGDGDSGDAGQRDGGGGDPDFFLVDVHGLKCSLLAR